MGGKQGGIADFSIGKRDIRSVGINPVARVDGSLFRGDP